MNETTTVNHEEIVELEAQCEVIELSAQHYNNCCRIVAFE